MWFWNKKCFPEVTKRLGHHGLRLTLLFFSQDGLVFRIQVAYHREPQVLRESVNAEGLLVVRDNEEAQALEMATIHKPLLTSTLHG